MVLRDVVNAFAQKTLYPFDLIQVVGSDWVQITFVDELEDADGFGGVRGWIALLMTEYGGDRDIPNIFDIASHIIYAWLVI